MQQKSTLFDSKFGDKFASGIVYEAKKLITLKPSSLDKKEYQDAYSFFENNPTTINIVEVNADNIKFLKKVDGKRTKSLKFKIGHLDKNAVIGKIVF